MHVQEANEMTEKMTREEYEQYSTARQASFVYRKSKLFDFSLSPHSFLSLYPVVPELTTGGFTFTLSLSVFRQKIQRFPFNRFSD